VVEFRQLIKERTRDVRVNFEMAYTPQGDSEQTVLIISDPDDGTPLVYINGRMGLAYDATSGEVIQYKLSDAECQFWLQAVRKPDGSLGGRYNLGVTEGGDEHASISMIHVDIRSHVAEAEYFEVQENGKDTWEFLAKNKGGSAVLVQIDKPTAKIGPIDIRDDTMKRIIFFDHITTEGVFGIEAGRSPESDIEAAVESLRRAGITVHVDVRPFVRQVPRVQSQVMFRHAILRESWRDDVSYLKGGENSDWDSIARRDAVISEHLRALAEKVRVGKP
jgi:hypothetical protein